MQRVYDPRTSTWNNFPDEATPEQIQRALNQEQRPGVAQAPAAHQQHQLTLDQVFGGATPPPTTELRGQQLTLDDVFGRTAPPPTAELREQPTLLQEATQPGGFLSPENIGMFGGGLIGGALGAPLGPSGAALGGVLGAGAGGMLGRGSEVLMRRLFGEGPQAGTLPLEQRPQPTVGEDLTDIAAASQRGMLAEMAGQSGGVLLGKAANVLAAPYAKYVNPAVAPEAMVPATTERARVNQLAQDLGIDLTAGQQTGRKALGLVESMTERAPVGAGMAQDFGEQQTAAAVGTIQRFLEKTSPGTERSLLGAGETFQAMKRTNEQAAKDAAEKLYGNVADVTQGYSFTTPALSQTASRMARLEEELQGLQTPVAGRMAQLEAGARMPAPQASPAPPLQTAGASLAQAIRGARSAQHVADIGGGPLGGTTAAAESPSLAEFVRQAGGVPLARAGFGGEQQWLGQMQRYPGLFNQNAQGTMEKMAQRALDAGFPLDPQNLESSFLNLLEKDLRASGDITKKVFANPGRQVDALFAQQAEQSLADDAAMRAYLRDALGRGKFKDLQDAYEQAANAGDEGLIRAINLAGERPDLSPLAIDRSEVGTLAQRLAMSRPDVALDPNRAPAEVVRQYNLQVDKPRSFAVIREIQSRLGELMRNAENAGNRRIAGQYSQLYAAISTDIASIGHDLPPEESGWTRLGLAQANDFYLNDVVQPFFDKVFKAGSKGGLDNIDPNLIAERVFGPHTGIKTLQKVKRAVGEESYNELLAAFINNSVDRSINNGQFEIGRLLTQWGPRQYPAETLQAILGPRYADWKNLESVFQAIQRSKVGAGNPSGTGQALATSKQVWGIIAFAAHNPGATAGGLIGGALGKKYGDAGMLAGGIAGGLAGDYLGGQYDFLPGGDNPYLGGGVTTGGILALSPIMLSRVLFHPTGIQWLTRGLVVQPGTKEALTVASKLMALASLPTTAEKRQAGQQLADVEQRTGMRRAMTLKEAFQQGQQQRGY